jgi:tetratricopeptide (TPR) repeat protein
MSLIRLVFSELIATRVQASNVQNERCRTLTFAICSLVTAILLSGCGGVQSAGDFQKGRNALMRGDPNGALGYLQSAAQLEPNFTFSLLGDGVWTYVGRAYYAEGKLPEAKRTFEHALSLHNDDHMARLYLGLTLIREGDRTTGLKEIEAGLRGLQAWFDNLFRTSPEGRYWDPSNQLRDEIKRILAMVEGSDVSRARIVRPVERLGRGFDNEIDTVQSEQIQDALNRSRN